MQTSRLVFATTLLASSLAAQTLQEQPPPPRPPDATVLQAGTRLVVVDVMVQDHSGHPIQGLKRDDFILTEDKKPQALNSFEEHTSPAPTNLPQLPPMPPGDFTNYTVAPRSGPLFVLLIDSEDTKLKDQMYVREQLEEYMKKAIPGTQIAIFGFSHDIYMIQGFTSDLSTLKASFDKSIIPTPSDLIGGVGAMQAIDNLARYLAAFPGRKNIIWFSSHFPIDNFHDPTQYSETANLLGQAQVSIFTIDAKGLEAAPVFSAADSSRGRKVRGPGLGQKVASNSKADAENIFNAEEIAQDTGGQTFNGNNGIANALRRDIDAGSNFYSVTYTPTNRKADGQFRSIHVDLSPALMARNYVLAYRHGYYSDLPPTAAQGKAQATESDNAASAATITPEDMASTTNGATYARAAMAHGAPLPQDIIFKVRVLPASTDTEDTLAPGNETDPTDPIHGPFRRYLLDYAALSNALKLTLQPDGTRTGAVEFSTFLYDNNGRLINATGETINLKVTPATYKQIQNGVAAHLEISVPAKEDCFLRIGVHDILSNRFGAVELPVSAVSKLAPPPPPPPPPAAVPPRRGRPHSHLPPIHLDNCPSVPLHS